MALMITNGNLFSKIEEINSDKATWNFKAKVIRMWQVSDFNRNNNPFSIEMVLMDCDGGRIHATIKKTLIYKFKDDLNEGKVYSFENLGVSVNGGAYRTTHHRYKLNFQFSSVVQRISNHDVFKSPFNLVPIADVISGSYDNDYLVDVIGVLTGVGSEREITSQNGTTTKLNVIELENEGHKLQCTLFGPYVDELNSFIASGDFSNAVVIVQFAKAKTFQDKMHIQNCMNCTRLFFNPNCDESIVLRASLPESLESPSPMTLTQIQVEPPVRPVDEFLFNTPRSTLAGLKDATTESINVVCATIKRVLNPECFWYTACVCNKSVIPDSNMFFCDKCNKHVLKVFPRYCMKIRVMDQTDQATFVIFDKDASSLFNMSCADMLELNQRNNGGRLVPPQLSLLVEKTWLFKVEAKPTTNTRFEQTFRVRKICTDIGIIKTFKDKWDKEEASISKLNNEVGSLSTLLDKGKDVLVCGSTNILAEDLLSLTGSSSKGKGKQIGCNETPVKVTQDLMIKFTDTVVDLSDDSLCTLDKFKIPSKDVHSMSASDVKDKGKDIVVDGIPVADISKTIKGKVIAEGKIAGDSDTSAQSTMTRNEVPEIDKKGAILKKDVHELSGSSGKTKVSDSVLEGVAVGHMHKIAKAVVVDLNDEGAGSPKNFVTPNQLQNNEGKGAKSKNAVKRVSPQNEDADDNAPIKLLKRAIKIEKIA